MKVVKALSIQKTPDSMRHVSGSLLLAFRGGGCTDTGPPTSRSERIDRECQVELDGLDLTQDSPPETVVAGVVRDFQRASQPIQRLSSFIYLAQAVLAQGHKRQVCCAGIALGLG